MRVQSKTRRQGRDREGKRTQLDDGGVVLPSGVLNLESALSGRGLSTGLVGRGDPVVGPWCGRRRSARRVNKFGDH